MKIKINKNKAGISRETGSMLLVVLAFVILILWMTGAFKGFFGETKIEVCHSQIMARHTFNVGDLEVGRNAVPLSSCQAAHICFVETKKEDCPELAGLPDIEKIEVATQDEIIEELAKRMQICWGMVGEGNLDYEPKGWTWDNVYCGICAKIAFSSNVNSEIGQINFKRLYDYMETNTIENGDLTYLQYLYNKDSLDDFREAIRTEAENDENFTKAGGKGDIYNYNIDTQNGYAIITGLDKNGRLGQVVGVVVGAIALPVIVGTGGLALVLVGAGGGYSILSIVTGRGTRVIPPQLVVYDKKHKEILDKIGCNTFDFLP